MKKNIDYMTFQCDNDFIQKILDEYRIPPDEKNGIIGLIHDLSENDQVVAIYLYGSYARKEPKPYSDVDIAVITQMMDPPRYLKEIIGSYSSEKIDVQVFSDLPLSAQMQVLVQGISLFVRNKDSLWRIIKSVSLTWMDLEPMRYRWRKRIIGV
jgi:predicted nucleotidyltransferase